MQAIAIDKTKAIDKSERLAIDKTKATFLVVQTEIKSSGNPGGEQVPGASPSRVQRRGHKEAQCVGANNLNSLASRE